MPNEQQMIDSCNGSMGIHPLTWDEMGDWLDFRRCYKRSGSGATTLKKGCKGVTWNFLGFSMTGGIQGDSLGCFTSMQEAQHFRNSLPEGKCKGNGPCGKPALPRIIAYKWLYKLCRNRWRTENPGAMPRWMETGPGGIIIWNDEPLYDDVHPWDYGYYQDDMEMFCHATLAASQNGYPKVSHPNQFSPGSSDKTAYCVVCEKDHYN